MRFIDNNIYAKNFIGKSLRQVIEYNNKHDYQMRNCELGKLAMLSKHLVEIKNSDEKLFGYFKSRFRKNIKNLGEYYGVRCELNIAASLIRKNIKFRKTEETLNIR